MEYINLNLLKIHFKRKKGKVKRPETILNTEICIQYMKFFLKKIYIQADHAFV